MNILLNNDDLINGVPDDLRQVISKTESITGIPVKILDVDESLEQEFPVFSRAAAILDIDPDRMRVSVWINRDKASCHILGHELIHLRRNIIEACPKMFYSVTSAPELVQEILFLENELEHQFVIREEISRFPEAENYWISHYEQQIELSSQNPKASIMHWCILRTLFSNHERLVGKCAHNLRSFNDKNILHFANDLQIELSSAFPNKLKMIDIYFNFFPAIRENVIVGKYVMKNGLLSSEPIGDG